tara:strand:- start:1450 stop:1632 length:183 start_codon:yes stop_codon:yes gene_type:complete
MVDWLKDRVTERTSIDGIVLVVVGVLALIAKPIIGLIAYVAIVYGIYTFCKSEYTSHPPL